jgi:hypothetical protein
MPETKKKNDTKHAVGIIWYLSIGWGGLWHLHLLLHGWLGSSDGDGASAVGEVVSSLLVLLDPVLIISISVVF